MDFSTTYLGMKLRSPLVPSACQPLTSSIDNIKRMEDAGAGAVVLFSLFEEQIKKDDSSFELHLKANTDSFSEASSFFPEPSDYVTGPEEYLKHIANAKRAVKIPIIASLNGSTAQGWTQFARQIEQAGADALEVNIFQISADTDISGAAIEEEYIEIVRDVCQRVKIPVAVKLSPYFTSVANMAKQIEQARAKGIVIFNRFYQPDLDLENLSLRTDLNLSGPLEFRVPLRWTALLYNRVKLDIALTSGIQRADDAIKSIMAGANVTMVCAALLRYGIDYLEDLTKKMQAWMQEKGYDSIESMRGSMSQAKCQDPAAFERAQYLQVVHRYRPGRIL
jgi:dihydroorotate dehydrogenase (fumarate)